MLGKRKEISPYTVILVSFVIIILIGGFLLSLPIAIENGQKTNLLEGMFTATSAVCVTGLTVNDVSKVYNLFGKTVIMILIQLGGIGIITFSTVVVTMISKKVGYFTKKLIQEDINTNTTFEIQKFVKKVLTTVFIIEIIGAAIL
ncbi:MAG: potassium transporter TrkG, partial [Leptotrichia hongkongensis]